MEKIAHAESIKKAMESKAKRRELEEQSERWIFEQDPKAEGAGRERRVKISSEYKNASDVASANGGNRAIVFREWKLITDKPEIRDYLRWMISEKKLVGAKETVNPVVACTVEGCSFKGTLDAIKQHHMSAHVGAEGNPE